MCPCPQQGGRDACGIQWIEARDSAKTPTMYRAVLQKKNNLTQYISWGDCSKGKYLLGDSEDIGYVQSRDN